MPELAQMLRETIDGEAPLLRAITDAQAAERPKPGGWSRKEELGHLLDSAVNNHVRFVRASLDGEFTGPGYAQDGWVQAHGYHELAWTFLIDAWRLHNDLLYEVVRRIPAEKLAAPCRVGTGDPVTLGFLIEDYVLHMRHHLDHVLARTKITAYPSQQKPA